MAYCVARHTIHANMMTNERAKKKYEAVQTFLRSKIESGVIVPGEKLPSESELMAQFGISRNAVRQAINELIKERLVESRQGIGTFCVKRTQGTSMLIAMVAFRISSYIFPRLVSACNQSIQRDGYTLLSMSHCIMSRRNDRSFLTCESEMLMALSSLLCSKGASNTMPTFSMNLRRGDSRCFVGWRIPRLRVLRAS